MPDLASGNFAARSAAERVAINTPVQGTAALFKELQGAVAVQVRIGRIGHVHLKNIRTTVLERCLHEDCSFEQAVKSGGVSTQVEQEMRETIVHLLDTERARVQAKEEAAQSDRILLLEKKIGRLARNLDQTEQERDVAKRHARMLP